VLDLGGEIDRAVRGCVREGREGVGVGGDGSEPGNCRT
jgi:hypothetical protein